jgi:acetylornithine deacetylase/succinyl-diaminopimelate desuccinylase-like protein
MSGTAAGARDSNAVREERNLSDSEKNAVLARITEAEVVQVATELVNIPSPTGSERRVAEYVCDFYERNGIRAMRQEIGEERMNAVGILKGTGGGVSLSFNGHMDVPYSGSEEDLLYMSKELFDRPAHKPNAFVKDGYLCGLGIGNMKASLAALLVALKAIKSSGASVKGDIISAAVCGEIGRTAVGRYQGLRYEGAGFGARYLVTHGVHSDYAICVDNSGLKLTWVQPGIMYMHVTVYGNPGGAWATGAANDRAASQNAVIKMQPVIDAIERWAVDYNRSSSYACAGGTVKPTASITSIEGGTPYKASMRPGVCTVNMIAMIAPGTKPLAVLRQLQSYVAESGVDAEVEMHQAHLGFEAQGVEGLVSAARASYRAVFDKDVEICDSPYCSVWTDTNTYNQNGIPCIKLGLGLSAEERLKVGNDAYDMHPISAMVSGSKLYARLALDICNRSTLN